MKKYGTVLSLLFFVTQVTTQVTFAQTAAPTPTSGSTTVLAQVTNPTPTAKVTPLPSSTPAPTTVPTVTQVTNAPTPVTANPTSTPQTQTTKPTPTPTPLPPTPTTKPKPVLLINRPKPPSNPINQIITAPFDLVMNSLPQSYYNDAGLAPTTTRILLVAGLLSIISGTMLLKWPSLVKAKNRMFAPTFKEKRAYPYVAGRL